jgi:FG-GAP-like repeat
VNGDGNLDILVSVANSNAVDVLINFGTGSFYPRVSYNTQSSPQGISLVDVNGDGFLDVAVVNQNSSSVSVLPNSGSGTFSGAATIISVGSNPYGIVTHDMNGDGFTDAVVSNGGDNTVTILLGYGNGTITPSTHATEADPKGLFVADFDGKGFRDIVVSNFGANTFSFITAEGSGGIISTTTTGAAFYLELSIQNPFAFSLNDVDFVTVLPASLVILSSTVSTQGAGCSVPVISSNTITLTGGVVAATNSCIYQVSVRTEAAGEIINTASFTSSSVPDSSVSATLVVLPSRDLFFEVTCGGAINILPSTGFAISANFASLEAAAMYYMDRTFEKIQCECPAITRADFDRLYNLADPSFWVAYVTGAIDRSFPCVVPEFENWGTSWGV